MKTELEEVQNLVKEMAVLWVIQHPAELDLEGASYQEAFELIRRHPRFNAMIMTAWMSGRWYQENIDCLPPEEDLAKEFQGMEDRDLERRKSRFDPAEKVHKLAEEMKAGDWTLRQPVAITLEELNQLPDTPGKWDRTMRAPWQE